MFSYTYIYIYIFHHQLIMVLWSYIGAYIFVCVQTLAKRSPPGIYPFYGGGGGWYPALGVILPIQLPLRLETLTERRRGPCKIAHTSLCIYTYVLVCNIYPYYFYISLGISPCMLIHTWWHSLPTQGLAMEQCPSSWAIGEQAALMHRQAIGNI